MADKKEKKYLIDNPTLMAEWNWEKNNELGLDPKTLTLGINKKVWWKCEKGHEWQTRISHRNNGVSCPYCSGRHAIKGENDLATVNPKLASEWHYDKNGNLKPENFTANSGKKVWWKCNKEHEWQAEIKSRNKGNGCPVCSGNQVLIGYNDLSTINPKLASEWDYEKNGVLTPKDFTIGSGKKVWWKCEKGHEWKATIVDRNAGKGCPICANKKVIQGYNDLATLNSELASEWNYEKNGDLTPENVTAGSNKKVWWKCVKGHEWKATISNRSNGLGCPVCSGHKVLKGENDLSTINPKLAREWDYEKNGDLTPENVTTGSGKKVWWKCSKGHEWQATIHNRNKGRNCPICDSERKTSTPEYAILFYLKKYDEEPIHRYKEKGYELDVYIPSKKIAIEYDGGLWHKNRAKKDLEKNLKCKKDGIKLYRIREGLSALNDYSIDYIVDKKQKDLGEVVQKVISEIVGFSVDIDLKRDNIEIENLREYTEKENSLLCINPTLAKEWNYERNGDLRPEHILANSHKKVWWKCENGHEWQTTIANRNNAIGCPICSNKKVLIGYNDLATINPKLAIEWNYERNGNLKPEDFTAGSHQKVWWKCSKGHEWQATIVNRNKGRGCPICSNQKILIGYNDLATINPKLAKEWNWEKNNELGLDPKTLTCGSSKKAWWKCSKGHEWQAVINKRNKGSGCPYCLGNNKKG